MNANLHMPICCLLSVLLWPGVGAESSLLIAQSLPENVSMVVRLTNSVSSRTNQKGDTISATVVSPTHAGDLALTGATVEGAIQHAESSGSFKKESKLTILFSDLVLQNGRRIPISGDVNSFRNSHGQADQDEEGNVVKRSNGAKKALLLGAIGAAAGAGIGAAAGNAGKGAATGAVVGVAAAVLITFGTKAPEIRFDTGSELGLSVRPGRQ